MALCTRATLSLVLRITQREFFLVPTTGDATSKMRSLDYLIEMEKNCRRGNGHFLDGKIKENRLKLFKGG